MLSFTQATIMNQYKNFPASIPGCILWLPADSFYFEGTTLVGHDKSGFTNNCFQATAANQPGFIAATGSTPAYLDFDGNNDELTGNFIHTIKSNFPTDGEPPEFSFFILRRSNSAAQTGTMLSTSNVTSQSSDNYFASLQLTGTMTLRYITTGDTTYSNSSTADELDSGTASKISRKLYLNGVLQATTTASAVGGLAGITQYKIGNYFGTNLPWNGRVYEIIIYNRVLSDIERTKLESYLKTKIGL